jgi:fluoroquinolone transport system ATP-binding protein
MNITVEGLYHDYTGTEKSYAVEDVSFSIDSGEVFGFLGPSGAGKSTVQNIMTGLLTLQRGTVKYDDRSIGKMRSSFFNRIGVSFENPNLYSKLTALENLRYYAGLFDVATEDPKKLLELVGLGEHAHKRAGRFSKGMRQRLVFARSLINRPDVLFLDEPLAGLDPGTGAKIKGVIRAQQERGATIFLTTHDMHVADELCHRVAFLNEGRIVALDTPRALKLQHGERSVKVEHDRDGEIAEEVFFLDSEGDREKLNALVEAGEAQTIHSQEATLEQIFIKLTGRGLS